MCSVTSDEGLMANFLSRLLGSASVVVSDPDSAVASAPAGRPVAAHNDEGQSVHPIDAPWVPRDVDFWAQRSLYVLGRLRLEWSREPEAAKWPDVVDLLNLLSAPPDEIIRQLPAAARDAMALCDDEAIPRVHLADRLSQSPSLVQGLLRQANGAFYGAGLAPVLRVDDAIDRVGVSGTRAVVLAACVDGLLSKPGAPYDAMQADAWTHMVDSGPLARLLAYEFGADPEEAFAVGLLHDVGRLVIFDRISSLRASRRRPVLLPDSWLALLIEHLHEPLGAVAAHRWGLGAHAADAIGTHHRRERPAGRHPLAETLFLADRATLAKASGEPFDFDGIWGLGQLSGSPLVSRGILGRHVRAQL